MGEVILRKGAGERDVVPAGAAAETHGLAILQTPAAGAAAQLVLAATTRGLRGAHGSLLRRYSHPFLSAIICRFALGGGAELALACDVRVAGRDAQV